MLVAPSCSVGNPLYCLSLSEKLSAIEVPHAPSYHARTELPFGGCLRCLDPSLHLRIWASQNLRRSIPKDKPKVSSWRSCDGRWVRPVRPSADINTLQPLLPRPPELADFNHKPAFRCHLRQQNYVTGSSHRQPGPTAHHGLHPPLPSADAASPSTKAPGASGSPSGRAPGDAPAHPPQLGTHGSGSRPSQCRTTD
jgi:hypothetical protein